MMKEKSRARVCIPVCERRASDLVVALARACEIGDIVELRLDYLGGGELAEALESLNELLKTRPCPVILTMRPAEQGGFHEFDNFNRIVFWDEHFLFNKPDVDFADIELDLALFFRQREGEGWQGLLDWSRVICSYHDFRGVPDDLDEIYETISRTPARVMKIAVHARDAVDCLPVFHLLERGAREGREIIAVAMGQAGLATRILGTSRGSFLVFASSDNEHSTAPGQVTAEELREIYRVNEIGEETEVLGLVGLPTAHSVSPLMHNRALASRGLDAVYIPFEVYDLSAFIKRMVNPRTREIDWRLRGLSVTAPHKSAIIAELDSIDSVAEAIGAVNTVVVENNELRGYNTDAEAFLSPLREMVADLNGVRCAVIGAGGAARAVVWALRKEDAEVTLFARDIEKAQPLAEKFGVLVSSLDKASFKEFDLVVNTTPLGTRGEHEDETAARTDQLAGARIAYDLVYNPLETRFMREASRVGCETIGGLPMLVGQAAAQFKLWTSTDAPLEKMREAAKECFEKQVSDTQDESK
ncbi:MAG: shikimate dehydrogenase [Acidobacteria bacterium 13_1_20CM_3_53_8]|nr:MAG: shikimate dehydrogenase [Acidobacteria bacterium 13_1_20CM_3_53_8]